MQKLYIAQVAKMPDIVLQNTQAGRYTTIHDTKLNAILEINGVEDAYARVQGSYRFLQAKTAFEIIGVDPFSSQHTKWLDDILQDGKLTHKKMLVSTALQKVLQQHYYTQSFRFFTSSLQPYDIEILQEIKTPQTQPLVAIMTQEDAQKIFGYDADEFSDIAIYLSNENELLQVVAKLQTLYPNAKILTKEDMKVAVLQRFSLSKGVFVALFSVALLTFFMIVSDKASGLSSAERKEVGILKALGWRVETVLQARFMESFMIIFTSFVIGIGLGVLWVGGFDAVFVQNIFLQSNETALHDLVLSVDVKLLLLVFLLSAPVYIAATILPAWRVAVMDADEVLR